MPRRARLNLPNIPLHIIQRGNNRQACFFTERDYRFYLKWLTKYAEETGCQVHAYVLMTNHVHLLVSSPDVAATSTMMKAIGQHYVQYINRVYGRSGTLWDGRFHSCPTQAAGYFFNCQRYIELNPVRAGMVEHPGEYRWSSYRNNAHGEANRLIQCHQLYAALGPDAPSRQAAYRALFVAHLTAEQLDQIRMATQGNFILGDAAFASELTQMLGRRVIPGIRGRPKNGSDPI